MITPKPGETQVEFAIRFHESMADDLPRTDDRNRACFDIWREHGGDEAEEAVTIARENYSRDAFDLVRDVVVFTEHETEDRVDKETGKRVPGEVYGRDELVEMINGMNSRIIDCAQFSPLSKGHTDPSKDDEPETLGFAGGYRLGMIGNKEPRYAIFTDEYRRKDAAPEFEKRRGRSPEVWKYSKMSDRFFYPIATLGASAPRLDMPPARYSRHDIDGAEVEVERYMGVIGGNTGYAPTTVGGRDHYGNGPADGGLGGDVSDDMIHRLVAALFSTAPMQWVLQQMQAESQDAARPAVQNPLDAGGAGPMGGDPMGAGNPMGGGGGGPMGGGAPSQTFPPQAPQGPPNGNSHPMRYSRGTDKTKDRNMDNTALQQRVEQLEKELASERALRIRTERYSRLNDLREEFDLDVDAELERTANYTEEQFEGHCEVIRDHYRRNPESIPDYSALPVPAPVKASNELGPEDVRGIEKYAMENGMDYSRAREAYIRDRKAATV